MAIINTNLLSISSQANLSRAQSTLASAMERLSSGLRVNSAKDDAAGQAIGNRLSSKITGRAMAQRNANDGVSMAQTAHGALDQINDKLQRIRELSVQGLNGTLTTADSDAIQAEINQNLQEIDRLAATIDYNGIPLLTGQAGQIGLQVGANDREKLSLDLRPPGFSVEALGLEGLNIAGVDGEVVERDFLLGRARDIPLYNSATTLTFEPGARQPLYSASGFGYYTSDGTGGFSRVTVSATHTTATDTNRVNVHTPRAIFTSTLQATSESLPPLGVGQRLIEVEGVTYLEERQGDGSLAYRQAGFQIDYAEGWEERTRFDGSTYQQRVYPAASMLMPADTREAGSYSPVADTFSFTGNAYSLMDAANVTYSRFGSGTLIDGRLVESDDGRLYVATGSGEDERFSRLSSVQQHDRLLVSAGAGILPEEDEVFIEVGSNFIHEGTNYDLSDFDELFITPAGAALVQNGNGDVLLRTGASEGDYEYFELTGVKQEFDLTLRAASQTFMGADFSSFSTLIDPATPAVDFTGFDSVGFQGADFSELNNLSLVQRTTSDGQWMIRGQRSDGGFAYFEANLKIELDARGDPISVVAHATQSSPTVLGVESHEIERVWGHSEITIDPRNVTVHYTDAHGQSFEDVLHQNEDGNYYFSLPGESTLIGGYKTATLVDLEGVNEVLLRTVNGGGEVVVYYHSNVSMGTNLSVVALTDADGENDDGVPHTRLHIQELGDDFRLRVPRNPLAAIDRALGMVDAKRSHLGSMENRLASVIENHESTNISLSAARSRILDADYAEEVANMTKAQILQQAGTSMLAQANQVPQNVLSLLG